MIALRSYQHEGVNAIRESFKAGNRAPLYVLPTGGGKTIVFTYLARSVSQRQKSVLILVHRIELLRQTSQKLHEFGVPHGLINPNYSPRYYEKVQIGSVQTVINRLKYISRPDLIVIDEAHHAVGKNTWAKTLDYFGTRQLGVTATPIRYDGQGLGVNVGGQFDDMIIGPQIHELINMGYLVKPVIYAPMEKLDFSDVKIVRGDYDKQEVERIVDKSDIIGKAVEHYAKLCPGQPAVAFCNSVKHAEHVAEEFRAGGFRAESIDGSMNDEDRKRILTGLGNGRVQVVTSCDLISEGTDIPAIACEMLLRPTQSTGLFLQQVGRALRPYEGKDRAIILDHVGNVITHGLPDEVRVWDLDGERKKRKRKKDDDIKVLQCPDCFAVHEVLPECPYCGYVYPEKKKSEIELPNELEGTLEELTPESIALIKRKRRVEVSKAKSLSDLEKIAKSRGYKPGWAKYIFESRLAKQKINGNGR